MLNTTPLAFTLTVDGVDLTNLVETFSLRQDSINIQTPIVWQGNIVIAQTQTWGGIDLDNFINGQTWVEGNAVVLTINTTPFPLRIASYSYDDDNRVGTLQVSQQLDLLSYKQPPEDYRTINSGCSPTSISVILDQLLAKAGIDKFDLSAFPASGYEVIAQTINSITYGLTNAIPAPNRVNQSYIGLAQLILGERGYWLYHDTDETVRVKKWNLRQAKSFTRNKRQVVEFTRQKNLAINFLPVIYRVTGGGEVFDGNCDFTKQLEGVEEIYGTKQSLGLDTTRTTALGSGQGVSFFTPYYRGVIERIETEVIRNQFNEITVKKTGYKDLRLADEFGNEYTFDLYKIYEITESKYYDYQGRLYRHVVNKDGIALGEYTGTIYDLYPLALTWLTNLSRTTIEYYSDPRRSPMYVRQGLGLRYYDSGTLRLKTEKVERKFLKTYTFTLEGSSSSYNFVDDVKSLTIETWLENCYQAVEPTFSYRRRVYQLDPASIIINSRQLETVGQLTIFNDLSRDSDDATPPNWTLRPALCPRRPAQMNVTVRKQIFGQQNSKYQKREEEYRAQSITQESEARRLANMLGDLSVGRAYGYEVVLSLRDATQWLSDPSPLQTAWIDDKAVFLEAPSLDYDGKNAEIGWDAGTFGKRTPPTIIANPYVIVEAGGGETTPPPDVQDPQTEQDLTVVTQVGNYLIQIQLEALTEITGQRDNPDLTLISVDGNGDVLTSNGYVQATQNQNLFAAILVDQNGAIVVDNTNGDIVTTFNPYDDIFWNSILTVGGDVVTTNNEVIWV